VLSGTTASDGDDNGLVNNQPEAEDKELDIVHSPLESTETKSSIEQAGENLI
jgi:hypothetical protein